MALTRCVGNCARCSRWPSAPRVTGGRRSSRPSRRRTRARRGRHRVRRHHAWRESCGGLAAGVPDERATRSRRSRVTALRRRWGDVHGRVRARRPRPSRWRPASPTRTPPPRRCSLPCERAVNELGTGSPSLYPGAPPPPTWSRPRFDGHRPAPVLGWRIPVMYRLCSSSPWCSSGSVVHRPPWPRPRHQVQRWPDLGPEQADVHLAHHVPARPLTPDVRRP